MPYNYDILLPLIGNLSLKYFINLFVLERLRHEAGGQPSSAWAHDFQKYMNSIPVYYSHVRIQM
jgi:hypothetical protein